MKLGIKSQISRSPEGTLKKSCSSLGMKKTILGVIGSRFPAHGTKRWSSRYAKMYSSLKKGGEMLFGKTFQGYLGVFRGGNAAVKWQLLPRREDGTGAPNSVRSGRGSGATKVGKDLQDQQFQPFRVVHPWESLLPVLLQVKLGASKPTERNKFFLFSNSSVLNYQISIII